MSHNQPFDGRRAVIALTAAVALIGVLMYVVTPAGISYRFFNNRFKNTAR